MEAPWCFTLNPEVRVDLCDIEPCSEYLNTKTGLKVFVGNQAKTQSKHYLDGYTKAPGRQ